MTNNYKEIVRAYRRTADTFKNILNGLGEQREAMYSLHCEPIDGQLRILNQTKLDTAYEHNIEHAEYIRACKSIVINELQYEKLHEQYCVPYIKLIDIINEQSVRFIHDTRKHLPDFLWAFEMGQYAQGQDVFRENGMEYTSMFNFNTGTQDYTYYIKPKEFMQNETRSIDAIHELKKYYTTDRNDRFVFHIRKTPICMDFTDDEWFIYSGTPEHELLRSTDYEYIIQYLNLVV